MIINAKYLGTLHTVELSADACPYRQLSALLAIPPTRIKLIRAGRLVPPMGDPALQAALVDGATYMVSGSSEVLPSKGAQRMARAREAARYVWENASVAVVYGALHVLLGWLYAVGGIALSFFTSMVVAPPLRRPHHGQNED